MAALQLDMIAKPNRITYCYVYLYHLIHHSYIRIDCLFRD